MFVYNVCYKDLHQQSIIIERELGFEGFIWKYVWLSYNIISYNIEIYYSCLAHSFDFDA